MDKNYIKPAVFAFLPYLNMLDDTVMFNTDEYYLDSITNHTFPRIVGDTIDGR